MEQNTISNYLEGKIMRRRNFLKSAAAVAIIGSASGTIIASEAIAATGKKMSSNPLLQKWTTPFGVPPFSKFKPSDFMPAFEAAMASHKAELKAIATNKQDATFDNVFGAMERSGTDLTKVASVFFHLTSADTNEALQAIEGPISEKLSAHQSSVTQDPLLFGKIQSVYLRRNALGLNGPQKYLVENTYQSFVRGGALLDADKKKQVADIDAQLAKLQVQFDQNVLKGQSTFYIPLKTEADFAGLNESQIDAAKAAVKERGIKDALGAITLSRSSFEPFLTSSTKRDLREAVQKGWMSVGSTFGPDNRPLISQIVDLRTKRANLMGFKSFAAYQLDDKMAKTPENAMNTMNAVWTASLATAKKERGMLQELASKDGVGKIASWDWWYYAEKVRQSKYAIDENEVKPYFELTNMIKAIHYHAEHLFGLKFVKNDKIPTWHKDVVAYEVHNIKDGSLQAIWFGDFYARASKQSGAWMSSFRDQQKLTGDVKAVVYNICNYAKPSPGKPSLLSFDDASTLFHEFGHALHGICSDVVYPSQSGTSVKRDFVEFPSQMMEHWLPTPEILGKFARHWKTDEVIPQPLVDKLLAAKNFNEGWTTSEYMMAAIMDMKMHMVEGPAPKDIDAWEKQLLDDMGAIPEIVVRYRPGYFKHTFSGGYSAGYYSYIWAAVLETDGFNAFKEAGNVYDPSTSKRLKDTIFSQGGTKDPMELYIDFRGRAPTVDALLEYRGLKS